MRLCGFRSYRSGFLIIALSALPGWGQEISDTARQQIRDVLKLLTEGLEKSLWRLLSREVCRSLRLPILEIA